MTESSHYHSDYGDHIHDVAWSIDDEQFTPTVGFDYSEIDRNVFDHEGPDDQVDYSDMVAALAIILQWVCASPVLAHCGARASALLALLDPTNAPHQRDTLTKIAKEAGVTKQACSKWICELRDQTGLALTIGKLNGSREKYREAQLAAVERGTHGSFVRKSKAA